MRIVGPARIALPTLTPSAQGLAAARIHQATAAVLAAMPSTGIARGIYRFASHEAMNRATDEALVRTIAMNAELRRLVSP